MQETQQPQQQENGGPASPLKVFAILLALLLIAGTAIYLLTRDKSTPTAAPVTQEADNETLTEEEAIERLQELLALEAEMYRTLDESLLTRIHTANSKVKSLAEADIRTFRESGVRSETASELETAELLSATPDVVRIRATARVRPMFTNENGDDVTEDNRERIQVTVFTLRNENDIWKIHDALVESAEFAE